MAVPHVEVRFKGEGKETRTGEYQYAGPALQALAGLELRSGRVSYYLEYKFTWASIAAALTGDEGGKNVDLPSLLGVLEGPADLYAAGNELVARRGAQARALEHAALVASGLHRCGICVGRRLREYDGVNNRVRPRRPMRNSAEPTSSKSLQQPLQIIELGRRA